MASQIEKQLFFFSQHAKGLFSRMKEAFDPKNMLVLLLGYVGKGEVLGQQGSCSFVNLLRREEGERDFGGLLVQESAPAKNLEEAPEPSLGLGDDSVHCLIVLILIGL